MARAVDGLRHGGASIGRSESNKLFVGGLPRDVTEDEFVRYFEAYGEIIDAVVMRMKGTGASRGFGFVQFSRASTAERVMDFSKHHIGGKWVEVKRTMPDAEINVNRSGPPRAWNGPPSGFGGKGGKLGPPPQRYSSRSRSRRRYGYGSPPPPPPGRPSPYPIDPYAINRRTVRWPVRPAPPQDNYWGRPPPREAGINARLDRLRVEVARLNNGDTHWRKSGPSLMERGGAYGKGAPARRTREGDGWRQSTATRSDGKPPWAADGVGRTSGGGVQDTAGDEEFHGDQGVKTDDLPEGWEALEDEEGNIYFHHVPTGATQWESPLKDEHHEEATLPPVEESDLVAASQQTQHEESTVSMQEEGPTESKHDEEPEACPEEEEQAPRSIRQNDSLPPDWEEVEDVEGGVYYHHIPTGHTQWEQPSRDALAKDTQLEVADSSAPPDARSSSNHEGAPSL